MIKLKFEMKPFKSPGRGANKCQSIEFLLIIGCPSLFLIHTFPRSGGGENPILSPIECMCVCSRFVL